jgi:cyclic beta-1,2-glucan synthetase
LQLARTWLEHVLIEQGRSIDDLVHLNSQNQAADQVSVSHSIGSLRFLGAMDWKEFVETISIVEMTLRGDPADVYSDMEFSTRDQYRHAVESISRHGNLTESDVAAKSIELAKLRARDHGMDDRSAHVGYYLIDKGLPELEAAANVKRPWHTSIDRDIRHRLLSCYIGGGVLLTLLATFGFVRTTYSMGVDGWKILPFAIIFMLCASQLAVALMNWVCGILVKPTPLPRLDFSDGIDADCRTMVVVPTMISDADCVDRLIENLELHQLSNRDPHLHFALLTDFPDASQESMREDKALVARLCEGVDELNFICVCTLLP